MTASSFFKIYSRTDSQTWTRTRLLTATAGFLAVMILAGASGAVELGRQVAPGVYEARLVLPENSAGNFPSSSEGQISSEKAGSVAARPVSVPNAGGWVALLADDFESGFPGTAWELFFNENGPHWDDWTCSSGSTPMHSVGCAAGGVGAISCGENYPNDLETWMVAGPVSLADAHITAGVLECSLELQCETGIDFFFMLVSLNGKDDWNGFGHSGSFSHKTISMDLSAVPYLGNILGEPEVWVNFVFQSSGTNVDANGAQVDDVVLAVEVSQVDNVLALGSASGPSGTPVTVQLALDNEDAVKSIQTDIFFDGAMAFFSGVAATPRSAGMVVEGEQISEGQARITLSYDADTQLDAGSGDVADVTFTLQGSEGGETPLTLSDMILTSPGGDPLPLAGIDGHLTVEASPESPILQISVLKNPGRTRTLQILVMVSNGSGSAPKVTAGRSRVDMTSLGQGIYSGVYSTAQTAARVSISASDTNSQGSGAAQVTVNFQ